MDEIGYGLLDRTMIHRITERWHQGGIGVIILHLTVQRAFVMDALQSWASGQPLIWRYRMENDYFFFLQREKAGERLDMLVDKATETLRERLIEGQAAVSGGGRNEPYFVIGSAFSFPSGMGRSAEAMIYHAIKHALTAVMRHGLKQEPIPAPELKDGRGANGEQELGDLGSSYSIGSLAKAIPVFRSVARVSEVANMFETNPHLQGAVIVSQERPVGLVMKEKMHQMLAGQFGLPLYWNRSIEKIMDEDALVVDAGLPVEQVAQMAMTRDISRLYDIVTITRDGKLLGAASIRSILESMTNLRTEEARTANPLTGLPGNVVIHREMKRRIDTGKPFSIIYADLDYFKWFNDCFGFSQGDALIRYLAEVLLEVRSASDDKNDFIGHIGGDDFIVLSDAIEPAELCGQFIERFESGVNRYYGGVDVSNVVDRSGNRVEQNGVSLSLSLLIWDGIRPITPAVVSQAAARLKKQAKAIKGSAFIMENVFEMHPGEGRL
ncbi:GGDEF domain-containing protein [Paenibacillus sp. sptzw28]|uniref:GGDEF domain-containing protein n=1 Tax=Paenibacillus sp. sptzw28 TaxID=715179 RepID=UPI001C6E3A52|nr:GGDEF domain-containing protein [Paenibacillus sp. sptzw28]QYR23283.1 GGDEF domain-containing protein [Paenibacillus sp. sptzw28]